jgi:hypothetical protein
MKYIGAIIIGSLLGLFGFPVYKIATHEFNFRNLIIVAVCTLLWDFICREIKKEK